MAEQSSAPGTHFVRQRIEDDNRTGRYDGRVVTRFPPEPNGYLHIGHAKAICLDFGMAAEFGGRCHLRFDDTNPTAEEVEYVDGIQADVRWLGFDWGEHLYHASDYFGRLYDFACQLVRDGKAYVCSQTLDEMRASRGTLTEPGTSSPDRDRSAAESLALLHEMRRGDHPEGRYTLRAKIDMASPNMKMRDPPLYRILHAHHHRTGDAWHIYPMYDFAHCLSDAIEGVTHSLCTLEFDNNRELYDWILQQLLPPPHPQQLEFARLKLETTMMSKRRLRRLVEEGHVSGWDDPRMPTLAGIRRRGVRPEAIRAFAERVGVAKADSLVELALFEHVVRDDLNHEAPRVMGVLDPLELVVETWPEGEVDVLDADLWPSDVPREGTRPVPFGRTLWIERSDFQIQPERGFRRLTPGREVRLRYGYLVTCTGYETDPASGEVIRVRCSHDPASRGGRSPDGRKVRGTIHWVSAAHGVPAEVRLYTPLFDHPAPDTTDDFREHLSPASVEIARAVLEPSLAGTEGVARFQLERHGYFVTDSTDSRPDALVLNRIVALKDSWTRKPALAPTPTPTPEAPIDSGPSVRDRDRTPAEQARFDGLVAAGVADEPADVLASTPSLMPLYDAGAAAGADRRSLANLLVNDLRKALSDAGLEQPTFGGEALAALLALVDEGRISTKIARDVLTAMVAGEGAPSVIVAARGLDQIADPEVLAPLVAQVVAAFPNRVEAYRGGRTGLLGFFVGQVMKRTGGKANPQLVNDLLTQALASGS